MKTGRSLLPALLAAVLLAVAAPSALADGSINVTKSPAAGGTVTGTVPIRGFEGNEEGDETIIDCRTDCGEPNVPDYETCIHKPSGEDICTFHDDTVTLHQQRAAGWQFTGWTGCSSVSPSGVCSRTMSRNKTISASYQDVGAPTVALTGPVENAKLNGLVGLGAVAGDNAGVSSVRFYINNVEIANDTNGNDGWGTTFNTSAFPHAQVITVKAVALDTPALASVLGDDDDRNYRIDRQTGLLFEASTPAEGAWVGAADPAVTVAFAKNDDTPADSLTTTCNLGGGFGPCASPLDSGSFAADGDYSVTVKGSDDAIPTANTAQITRSFHVDRTAPAVTLGRPADGSVQPKAFTPDLNVVEANPADAGAVTCKLDAGAYGECEAIANLAPGAHDYSVKGVDKAGNETVVTHAFTVDGVAPTVNVTAGPKQHRSR